MLTEQRQEELISLPYMTREEAEACGLGREFLAMAQLEAAVAEACSPENVAKRATRKAARRKAGL
jgi:hypothetical protein